MLRRNMDAESVEQIRQLTVDFLHDFNTIAGCSNVQKWTFEIDVEKLPEVRPFHITLGDRLPERFQYYW